MTDFAAHSRPEDALDALIEERPRSLFRISLLSICFAVTLMDGAHQLTLAVSGPAISRDLAIAPASLGLLMAASEFGFMIGALALSPLVDRFGRKRMLLLATSVFGIFSIATAFAYDVPSLFAARLLTGLGLGCAGPAVVSLATEYTAARHRARIATLIWAANPAGAFLSGLIGGRIVPSLGWRDLFLVAGAVTIALVVLVALFVPESIRFLLAKAPDDPRVTRILRHLGAKDARAIVDRGRLSNLGHEQGVPVGILFRRDNRRFTVALWLAFFLCFMCLLATLTWTVSILSQAGLDLATSATILACNTVGGTLGVALAGWAVERVGGARVLLSGFAVGILTIIGMGQAMHNLPLIGLLSGLTGLSIGGNTAALIALAVNRYPTTIRATGLGWGLAAGRLGGALGPVLMGIIAGTGVQPPALFAVIAIPAFLAAIVVVFLSRSELSGVGDIQPDFTPNPA